MTPDYRKIDPAFKHSIDIWVTDACHPGGFLTACLENNLKEAVGRADEAALDNLPHVVAYLYSQCPGNCWGTKERVAAWPQTLLDIKRTSPKAHDILRQQRARR